MKLIDKAPIDEFKNSKIIDNYNIYLLSELRKFERTFDVANMINGLN